MALLLAGAIAIGDGASLDAGDGPMDFFDPGAASCDSAGPLTDDQSARHRLLSPMCLLGRVDRQAMPWWRAVIDLTGFWSKSGPLMTSSVGCSLPRLPTRVVWHARRIRRALGYRVNSWAAPGRLVDSKVPETGETLCQKWSCSPARHPDRCALPWDKSKRHASPTTPLIAR